MIRMIKASPNRINRKTAVRIMRDRKVKRGKRTRKRGSKEKRVNNQARKVKVPIRVKNQNKRKTGKILLKTPGKKSLP